MTHRGPFQALPFCDSVISQGWGESHTHQWSQQWCSTCRRGVQGWLHRQESAAAGKRRQDHLPCDWLRAASLAARLLPWACKRTTATTTRKKVTRFDQFSQTNIIQSHCLQLKRGLHVALCLRTPGMARENACCLQRWSWLPTDSSAELPASPRGDLLPSSSRHCPQQLQPLHPTSPDST